MKGQEMLHSILRDMRREPPAIENPWATEAAAETLELNGQHKAAKEVRAAIGPTAPTESQDPMEFWILVEDAE